MGRCALYHRRWSARVRWLPWQQLYLVLCGANNFYGKLSRNVARTIRSNGTDTGRCLWKLLAISLICVGGHCVLCRMWDNILGSEKLRYYLGPDIIFQTSRYISGFKITSSVSFRVLLCDAFIMFLCAVMDYIISDFYFCTVLYRVRLLQHNNKWMNE